MRHKSYCSLYKQETRHRNNMFDSSQQTTHGGSSPTHNEEDNNATDSLNDNLISQQSNIEYDSDSMLYDPSANIPTPSTPNNNFVVINDNEVNVTSQITQATNSSSSTNTSNNNTTHTAPIFPNLQSNSSTETTLPNYLFNTKFKSTLSKKEIAIKKSEFICKTYSIDDVVLNEETKSITCIGTLLPTNITSKMLSDFIRNKLGHTITADNRTLKKMYKILYTIKSAGDTIEYLKKKQKASIKKRFKPGFLKYDGTLFRIVNVLTSEQGRSSFISTKKDYDRVDIDSNSIPHYENWVHLLGLYNDTISPQINILSEFAITKSSYFTSHLKSEENNPKTHDELSVEEFKTVTDYIMTKYKISRQKKYQWKT